MLQTLLPVLPPAVGWIAAAPWAKPTVDVGALYRPGKNLW